MFRKLGNKERQRERRKSHIRKTVRGTASRPRLTITKSNKNMSAQAVNDDEGKTLAAISTLEKQFSSLKPIKADAAKLGAEMGKRLKDKGILEIVFDRNGYLYHGVVKEFADAARAAGIKF